MFLSDYKSMIRFKPEVGEDANHVGGFPCSGMALDTMDRALRYVYATVPWIVRRAAVALDILR